MLPRIIRKRFSFEHDSVIITAVIPYPATSLTDRVEHDEFPAVVSGKLLLAVYVLKRHDMLDRVRVHE